MTKRHISKPWEHWRESFPLEKAQVAAEHVTRIWERVRKTHPQTINSRKREASITEFLWAHIHKTSLPEARLTGKWTYEDPQVIFNADGDEVTSRTRSDITYFSDRDETRLFLVFEFKKLKDSKSSRKTYQGESGMRRFVDGYYSIHNPLAIMVGMLIGDGPACVEELKRSLMVNSVRDLLCIVPANGAYLRIPSEALPKVAQFDTEHRRPLDQAPNDGVGTTTLAHIFFEFSSE